MRGQAVGPLGKATPTKLFPPILVVPDVSGRPLLASTLLLLPALAGCLAGEGEIPAAVVEAPPFRMADDAVVVAVVDFGLNPYHLDWAASTYPLHLDADPANDLPLDQSPEIWLPGFVVPGGGVHALPLTLPDGPDAKTTDLLEKDKDVIKTVKRSTADEVHLYHVPGTKVIGYVDFAGEGAGITTSNAHGAKASSVAVGNVFGACPECLLVFVNNGGGEDPVDWAMRQPWIDAVTNSYGYAITPARDRLYSGSDLALQREASERGQTVFFSAGNGIGNTFHVPNPTLFSSQEGPDWIVTVGAISPGERASYSGHGKPADIASFGSDYPSQGGPTVSDDSTFGGTSSATPTVAGTYARALWKVRALLDGPSRVQANGTIAVGAPVACGPENPACELGDGNLTVTELRTRLLHGAVHTENGATVDVLLAEAAAPALGEEEFLSEGHGSYFGRMDGDDEWEAQLLRIVGPMTGAAAPLERPAGEAEFFLVDSWCRQQIWGEWTGGFYQAGNATLPGPDPAWPVRTAYLQTCDKLFPPTSVTP